MREKFQNLALLVIRLIVAIVFLFAAWAKFSFWTAPPAGFSAGIILLIKFLSIVEPLGAAALIFGFLTRWAASGLAIIMVGAIVVLHFTMQISFFTTPQGLGWDYNLFILGNCLAIMAFGADKWSVEEMRKNYIKSFES